MKPHPEFPILRPERSAYEWQESANDAEASKQIEHDQKQAGYVPEPLEPLPADYFDKQPF